MAFLLSASRNWEPYPLFEEEYIFLSQLLSQSDFCALFWNGHRKAP